YCTISSSGEERRIGHRCHSERSEESHCPASEILRCAQNDKRVLSIQPHSTQPLPCSWTNMLESMAGRGCGVEALAPPMFIMDLSHSAPVNWWNRYLPIAL